MVDIKVTWKDNNLDEREQKILEVLLLNLAAQANAQTTKANMIFNPLEKENEDIFHFQFAWQSAITPELFLELKEGIEKRYKTALKMCEIPDCEISFIENSYQISN